MTVLRAALIGATMACVGAAWACPAFGEVPAGAVKTAFAVLVGFPSSEQSPAGGMLLVPGTVIPLTDDAASSDARGNRPIIEKSLSFSKAVDKLWGTFRLDPGRKQQLGMIEQAVIGKAIELPAVADANVRISATLLRSDATSTTFRVVFKQGEKILADSTANVARGGRAVVGGMDGPAAPYVFVFLEPEAAADTARAGATPIPPGITEPKPIYQVPPKYPQEAKEERVQGTVVVRVIIDTEGNVIEATGLEDPDPRLTQAAIEAIRQWKFQPAVDRDGKPLRVVASIAVYFKLK